ncbi:uncharacterized protein LOC133800843 isoform X2 [Humulus lupulus]|uniref:uncharacterized protein LOC133800843 isoform X2 n=1 Tax=Humulus lupulus TaxID=3486 RepID=UPI002B41575E|nr:uncharacterized protein LOC133800843 isoform X2 [Humulus lupulus]
MIKQEKLPEKLETVGAFQKLPMVMQSFDILYSAIKKAKRVSPTKDIANIAKRERNSGAKQLDALMKELAAPLRTYMESFPKRHTIHPYERSLIELTLGDGNYHYIISRIIVIRCLCAETNFKETFLATVCKRSILRCISLAQY